MDVLYREPLARLAQSIVLSIRRKAVLTASNQLQVLMQLRMGADILIQGNFKTRKRKKRMMTMLVWRLIPIEEILGSLQLPKRISS